jgi:hypothetical protein
LDVPHLQLILKTGSARAAASIAIVGLCAALAALATACGSRHLDVNGTERALKREISAARDIKCIDGSYGWDYSCSYTVIVDGDRRRFTIGVSVDEDGIVERGAP